MAATSRYLLVELAIANGKSALYFNIVHHERCDAVVWLSKNGPISCSFSGPAECRLEQITLVVWQCSAANLGC